MTRTLYPATADSQKWPSHWDEAQDKQERRTPLHFLHGLAEKAGDEDCVAGAERYCDFVRDWCATAVGGGYEMVLRRCAGVGIAAGWGLLAHGVGGGGGEAAADAGDWLGALQT